MVKRNRRKIKIMTGLFLCLTIGLLSGCKKDTVDYRIDDEETAGGDNASLLAQFADAKEWKDDWEGTTEEGGSVNIHVDTEIKVPQVDSMSVMELTTQKADAAYKEKIIKAVFGDTDVYYYDDVHLPKELLQKAIDEWKETKEIYQEIDMDTTEMDEMITLCEEALKTASDEYTLATDYEADVYLGYRNGIAYVLTFYSYSTEKGEEILNISLEPQDYNEVGPEGMDVGAMSGEFYITTGEEPEKTYENPCELTEQEATKMAESFLGNIGITGMVHQDTSALMWLSEDFAYSDESGQEGEEVTDGYYVTFALGVDEVTFSDFGELYEYSNYHSYGDGNSWFLGTPTATVCVTDDGVVSAYVYPVVEITKITQDVKLLPLENIQNIMRSELTENSSQFLTYGTKTQNYDDMELIYFLVKDKTKAGYYSYVPTWRLCRIQDTPEAYMSNPVLINAIDGSVINLLEGVQNSQ